MINEFVIVRTYSAGVHCGTLEALNGTQVILKNATRLWQWRKGEKGSLSLSSVSQHGAGEQSRIDGPVPQILLTQAIEVIPCSEKAAKFLAKPRNN